MPVQPPQTADILGNGPAEEVPPRRTRLLIVGGVAFVLVGVLVGVALGPRWRHETHAVPVTGTFVLDFTTVATPVSLGRSDQDEGRGGVLSGPLTLTTPDHELTTSVSLDFSGSLVPAPGGPTVMHVWGTAHLALQGTSCEGPAAWSFYYDPPEGFGAINVHCQDGAELSGRLRLTDYQDPRPEHSLWRITLQLDKAFFTTDL